MPLNTVYDKTGSSCSGGARKGTKILEKFILTTFAGSTTMGTYNCRSVRGGAATSLHGEGRAVDIGGTPEVMRAVADWAVANSLQWGIQEVIYARQIWSSGRHEEGWRKYTGQADHYDHVHIGQTHNGSKLTAVPGLLAQSGFLPSNFAQTLLPDYTGPMAHEDDGEVVQKQVTRDNTVAIAISSILGIASGVGVAQFARSKQKGARKKDKTTPIIAGVVTAGITGLAFTFAIKDIQR